MVELVKDLELLRNPSEPLKFIGDNTLDKTNLDEGKNIISKLEEVFNSDKSIIALAAPQIGISKRIFGIRFDDKIKYFINPIITKKTGMILSAETYANVKNKEYLIGRPNEISVVYYNQDFKYEDNKILGEAAKYFDQMTQLLDGILPSDLGLESDIENDGSIANLTEEELQEAFEIWKQFVKKRLSALEEEINADKTMNSIYKQLKFSENVINGRAAVLQDSSNKTLNRSQRRYLAKKNKKGKQ